jgi:site-specific recombinase XerD
MDAIFESYLAAQQRRRCAPLTLKASTQALRSAQRWLDQQGIAASELSLVQCEVYFDELLERGAISTVRRHLAYLRAAYRYAIRHGLTALDPTSEVRLPRLPDWQPVTYSNDQLRQIHAAIRNEREELAFLLFAFAGLRLGEVAALTWQQVDLPHGQLRLIGKSAKFRLVPLHPVLEQILREQQPTARLHDPPLFPTIDRRTLAPATLGRQIRTLVDRADIEVESPSHAFRRTVASVMYEQGVRTRVIERIMGWAPRLMYERHYLRVADEQMRTAIQTLYYADPICSRQQQPVQPPSTTTLEPTPDAWLKTEKNQLDALEQRLDLAL